MRPLSTTILHNSKVTASLVKIFVRVNIEVESIGHDETFHHRNDMSIVHVCLLYCYSSYLYIYFAMLLLIFMGKKSVLILGRFFFATDKWSFGCLNEGL